MPQVGIWIIRNHLEIDSDRQTEQIARLDGNIERGVIHDPHSTLHPVDDREALVTGRPPSADEDARAFGQTGQFLGNLCFVVFVFQRGAASVFILHDLLRRSARRFRTIEKTTPHLSQGALRLLGRCGISRRSP